MKITKTYLKQVIKEELGRMEEGGAKDPETLFRQFSEFVKMSEQAAAKGDRESALKFFEQAGKIFDEYKAAKHQ